jgi:sporulation protein YlmC with PRC-barrel domain
MNRARLCGLAAAVFTCSPIIAGAQAPGAAPSGLAIARTVLASELIGMRVQTPSGERVGEVRDLVLSSGNAVSAAVVSIGGFLGLGAKPVEVPYDKLAIDRSASIVVSLSREELEAMPAHSTASYSVVPAPTSNRADTPPPTPGPDAEARSQANDAAARSFATDDPRVANGIAENKEAFDGDGASGVTETK